VISEGVAYIEWKTEATKRLSEEIKEKQPHAESLGLTCIKENDVLGVSSYNGWKEAWPGTRICTGRGERSAQQTCRQ